MAFKLICDFCEHEGKFEYENGNIFIVCDNCGQEREVTDYYTYLKERQE